MAIYHLHDQAVSRISGRSPVAMAAYRSGERLVEEMDGGGKVHDYRRKSSVVHREVMVPEGAPGWMGEREALWNGVVHAEKRKDAVYLHEMDVAIPIELSQEEGIALVRDFARTVCAERGMVVDIAVHWEEGNPHAHLMQTTRVIAGEGFGKKNRDWHRKAGLKFKREAWESCANRHLERAGYTVRIDARSYADQQINLLPSYHEGVTASRLEEKGIVSWIKEKNQAIADANQERIADDPSILLKKLSHGREVFSEADLATEVFKWVQGDEGAYHALMERMHEHPGCERVKHADGTEAGYRYRATGGKEAGMPCNRLEEAIEASMPLLRAYHEAYRTGTDIRHRQKWESYRQADIQHMLQEQKDCNMQLDQEAIWLQAETMRWFEGGAGMSGLIAQRDKKKLVGLYHGLPCYRLKMRHRVMRLFGQKRRQDQALALLTERLKTYLERIDYQQGLDQRLLSEQRHAKEHLELTAQQRVFLSDQLQQLEGQIQKQFGMYGNEIFRSIQVRAQDGTLFMPQPSKSSEKMLYPELVNQA